MKNDNWNMERREISIKSGVETRRTLLFPAISVRHANCTIPGVDCVKSAAASERIILKPTG
jgi:hypothetical protein